MRVCARAGACGRGRAGACVRLGVCSFPGTPKWVSILISRYTMLGADPDFTESIYTVDVIAVSVLVLVSINQT